VLKLWRWSYARLYVRFRRTQGKASDPAWTAACLASALIAAQFGALAIGVTSLLRVDVEFREHRLYVIGAAVLLFLAVYWRYVVKGAAGKLIRKAHGESEAQTRDEERKLRGYTIGSLALPFVVGLLIRLLGLS